MFIFTGDKVIAFFAIPNNQDDDIWSITRLSDLTETSASLRHRHRLIGRDIVGGRLTKKF